MGDRAHMVASQAPGRDGAGNIAVAACGTVWRLREGVDIEVQGTELMCSDCVRLTLPDLRELMLAAIEHAEELKQRVALFTELMEAEEPDGAASQR